jgi:two-component system NtrC family sensor kinase
MLAPLDEAQAGITLDGDAVALEQLFLNLLLNAAQALPPGGVARVTLATEGQRVIVRIIDNGPGIAALALVDDGALLRTTKPGGTGLGLPIARRIAAAHGGELRIESTPGNGTTVVVRLPMRYVEENLDGKGDHLHIRSDQA